MHLHSGRSLGTGLCCFHSSVSPSHCQVLGKVLLDTNASLPLACVGLTRVPLGQQGSRERSQPRVLSVILQLQEAQETSRSGREAQSRTPAHHL